MAAKRTGWARPLADEMHPAKAKRAASRPKSSEGARKCMRYSLTNALAVS